MRGGWFDDQWWVLLVWGSAIGLGILVSAPQWLHMLDARYEGIPVHLNADEWSYLPRVEEALLGRTAFLGTAITGGSERLPVLQPSLLEAFYGTLLRPFGWRAATVLQVLDLIEPMFLFIVLVLFLQALGFSRTLAYAGAVLFSLLELYNLNRPVHQRGSFLLLLVCLWALIEGVEGRVLLGVLGGALMGWLVGVYFWSFSAAWAFWLLLLLVSRAPPRLTRLLFFGCVGLLAVLPFLFESLRASQHPLYRQAFIRSGIGFSHIPESWPWTVLFALIVGGVLWMSWQRRLQGREQYAAILIVTAFVLLNQQVVHGVLFLFASHYLFTLVLAAIVVLLLAWEKKTRPMVIAAGAAAIFLLGIATDSRSLIGQWRIDAEDFEEQHLSGSLEVLDALPRTVVLADPLTSSFIASFTGHDVLFTHYIQHELLSHSEIAKRYCLTQLPLAPEDRKPETELTLVYGPAYDGIRDPISRGVLRQAEFALVTETCAAVDAHPRATLERYGVTHILWDEERFPHGDLGRLGVPLERIVSGQGWSLWRVR